MASSDIFREQNYEVGFGKPPKETRFKKGASGNPAGRPKDTKNKDNTMRTRLYDVILNEAYREVEVSERNGLATMTVAKAVVRSIAGQATKGRVGAQRLFLESLHAVEKASERERHEFFKAAVKYKQDWTAAIKRAEQNGDPAPDMIPHLDDIEVDFANVEVIFHGPIDDREKAEWDRLFAVVEGCEEVLGELEPPRSKAKGNDVDLPTAATVEFLLLDCGLQIMRRWHVGPERVVKNTALQAKLELHFMEGTDPPPLCS